jgi:hypothetical protein
LWSVRVDDNGSAGHAFRQLAGHKRVSCRFSTGVRL